MITPIKGGVNAFTAAAYGMPDPLTIQWCEQRVQHARQYLMPEVQHFFNQSIGTVYDDIDYQAINQMAKASHARMESVWVMDTIQPLHDIHHIQNACPTMINWIMANPTIRQKYHDQEIAGFDQYYKDPNPEQHGEDYDQYREVINGVFIETGNEEEMVATEWVGEFDNTTLDFSDQVAIMDTWQNVLAHISAGREDPTSTFNAML